LGNDTIVRVNTTGTDVAEMEVVLRDFTASDLHAADFIL
jgi:hypothetical protein